MLPVSLDCLCLIAGQSSIGNLETLATLGTEDMGRRQTKQGAIKHRQSRDTGNIGMLPVSLDCLCLIAPCFVCLRPVSSVPNVASVSRLSMLAEDMGRRQTKQGANKHRQSRDTGNIGYTRHGTKTNKTRGNQA
jgi:hypothetical protein